MKNGRSVGMQTFRMLLIAFCPIWLHHMHSLLRSASTCPTRHGVNDEFPLFLIYRQCDGSCTKTPCPSSRNGSGFLHSLLNMDKYPRSFFSSMPVRQTQSHLIQPGERRRNPPISKPASAAAHALP